MPSKAAVKKYFITVFWIESVLLEKKSHYDQRCVYFIIISVFYHNSFFLNRSVTPPISSLHSQLIINKSAFVRDFDKEANQKYLKMLSFDPWWVLIILDMRALMLLFCFVLFFRNLMIILMVSQNIMTYQKSAGLNDLPIIFITLISCSLERKQTNCSFSQWILLGKTYCT